MLIKFHWSLFLRAQLTKPSIGLDNGLVSNRQQAIIWTNADLIHWHIYAALGVDELMFVFLYHLRYTAWHESCDAIVMGESAHSTLVADGLSPTRHQDIGNHLCDIGQSFLPFLSLSYFWLCSCCDLHNNMFSSKHINSPWVTPCSSTASQLANHLSWHQR